MDSQIKVRIILQKDLLDAGCFNIPEVLHVVEDTLQNYEESNVYFPDKTSMIFDEESQNRINFLPAGFADMGIYGAKWISVFPRNPQMYNKPNVSAVSILSELKTGFPIAIMDGVLPSNLRTASMGAVAAKYLARSDSETIGFIGAGEEAKSHFMTLKHVLPDLTTCQLSSRTREREQEFIDQLSPLYPDVTFIPCEGDYEKAIRGADVIVTAISGQEPILKADWIKEGAFYCHVAGVEDEYQVALKADKIVVDDWEVVKHRTQTISRMYREGFLKDGDIYANLHEIVKGSKLGRESDQEFIYFNSVGLSYIDTAVSYAMYQKVMEKGLGTEMIFSGKMETEGYQDKIIL